MSVTIETLQSEITHSQDVIQAEIDRVQSLLYKYNIAIDSIEFESTMSILPMGGKRDKIIRTNIKVSM